MTEQQYDQAYYGENGLAEQPVQAQPVGYGTIESILAAPDVNTKDLYVPEWNCMVKVQGLTKAQQHQIRSEASRGQKNGEPDGNKVEMLLFLTGVVEPKFGREHYAALLNKNSGVLDRIIKEIGMLSGVGEDAIDEAAAQFPR
jgi:hypothetical protein